MANCPYLEYKSNSYFGTSTDRYICKLTGQEMRVDDVKVKFTCRDDNGEHYRECQVYKSK